MSIDAGLSEAERFRAIVARRLGLHFEDAKLDFLAEILSRRTGILRRDVKAYLAGLDDGPAPEELAALAGELTVPETYFFRNHDQFRACAEVCLPERLRARADQRCLRLLSAGCATGEEAYSLAILAKEVVPMPPWEVSILGVDVNPVVLARALRARYSPWALRETTSETQQRWFRFEGRDALLDDSVRNAVRFVEGNLAAEDPRLWAPETYDVIFCRNVIMYFTPECARAVVHRLARSLTPGGYLFLGHAETLRGLSNDFHLRHTHETFYYQRKEPLGSHRQAPPADGVPSTAAAVPLMAVVENSDSWVEVIRRASERIEVITTSPIRAAVDPQVTDPARRSDLGGILDLLRQERFADALGLVQALPPTAAQDPDVLLLRAVLLVHSSQTEDAEGSCRALLGIDELNAGAHYVLALCREAVGDPRGAADHDHLATYLDRAFAMPRLHLGLIARRQGDHATACRELAQALTLLQREDSSRLLLFGGGFGREALLALCQAELAACGGRS